MHSATKYLNGHSDVIAGALATARDDELWQRIRYVAQRRRRASSGPSKRGCCCAACARCILRVRAACANAQAIAERFDRASEGSRTCSIPGLRRTPATRWPRSRCRAASAACCRCGCASGEEAAKAFTARLRGIQARDLARLGSKASPSIAPASRGRERRVLRISCAFRSASSMPTT